MTHFRDRHLEEHISGPLHSEKFTRNPDDIAVTSTAWGECVVIWAYEILQRRRVVYVCCGFFLDCLKDIPLATGHDGMELVINLANFRMETALKSGIRNVKFSRNPDVPVHLA